MMDDEGYLPFETPPRKTLPERCTVILTWWDGRVVSDWQDLNIESASFATWHDALATVLHPLNIDRLIVKVRA